MLFDKNGIYFIDDGYKDNYDFAVDFLNGGIAKGENTASKSFYSIEEALKRGNLFPSLYDKYKNYEIGELKVNSKREQDLLKIQMLDFAINDLNLYLNLHPDDKQAFSLFKKYTDECLEKKREYSNIYGPLTIDDVQDEFEWSKGVWPWEEGGM